MVRAFCGAEYEYDDDLSSVDVGFVIRELVGQGDDLVVGNCHVIVELI